MSPRTTRTTRTGQAPLDSARAEAQPVSTHGFHGFHGLALRAGGPAIPIRVIREIRGSLNAVAARRGLSGPARWCGSCGSWTKEKALPVKGGPAMSWLGETLVDLEQAGAALAAADAHGHHAPLGAAALAFLQDVAG